MVMALDAPAAFDHDRFEVLGAHDGANTSTPSLTIVVAIDSGKLYQAFACRTNTADANLVVSQSLAD